MDGTGARESATAYSFGTLCGILKKEKPNARKNIHRKFI